MKLKLNEGTLQKILLYTSVIVLAIVTFFAFYHMKELQMFMKHFFSLISPFIIGFSIAFLLNEPMQWFENKVFANVKIKSGQKRVLSALLSLIIAILVIVIFLWLVIPQLFGSIFNLIDTFPTYVENFRVFLDDILSGLNLSVEDLPKLFSGGDILTKISDVVTQVLPELIKSSFSIVSMIFNLVLGIMAAMYMLVDKERLLRHTRMATYATFPKPVADYLRHVCLITKDIFNNFIIGKAIDSLIIGILCYVGMNIINLPYAILLSVFVGITNMIPVFGPLIGAVPGVIILLIINPMYSIYFALFILLLQQFDGNILGPLILGDKLGLPSIWILFAVCVGGGLLGIVGMFIGVPLFAVFYTLLKELFLYRLEKKNMSSIE